jgi:hypothetical protein
MTDDNETPQFREHLHEIRKALGGIGHDVKVDVEDAPHKAKVGTKNALARAAGVNRTPIEEWGDSADAGSK